MVDAMHLIIEIEDPVFVQGRLLYSFPDDFLHTMFKPPKATAPLGQEWQNPTNQWDVLMIPIIDQYSLPIDTWSVNNSNQYHQFISAVAWRSPIPMRLDENLQVSKLCPVFDL